MVSTSDRNAYIYICPKTQNGGLDDAVLKGKLVVSSTSTILQEM